MERIVRRRIHIIAVLFVIVSILYFFRLMDLHFSRRITVSHADSGIVRRGEIHSSDGSVLAIALQGESLYANPAAIDDPVKIAGALSPDVGIPPAILSRRLASKKRFVWIRRHLDDETAERIRSLKLPGIGFRKEYRRFYPHRELAANTLGFVGSDNHGLEGVEYSCDDILSKIGDGHGMPGMTLSGNTVVLTINSAIQYIAARELDAALSRHNARQGSVLVMEVKTGRILALAKAPTFDPNQYGRYSRDYIRSFSIIDSFEPGSTMKIITVAALLAHNPDALRYRYTCNGSVLIGDTTINCTDRHGTLDMAGIIRNSCNVGIITSVRHLPQDKYYLTLRQCGFGVATGSGIPGESAGLLRTTNEWSGLSRYSLSMGHEMSVTSLQLAAAFSAIGNRGIRMKPAIIERIETPGGVTVRPFSPVAQGRMIPEEHAAILMRYMEGVVKGGTGTLAAPVYYTAAGKTGTSKKFSASWGGYSDSVISSFIGLVPAADPVLCILIVVDDPADRMSGGSAAAPLFSHIADRSLAVMGVKNRPLNLGRGSLGRSRSRSFSGIMPDLRGLWAGEAMSLVSRIQRERPDLQLVVSGSGKVVRQSPAPGTDIEKINGINIVLERER